MMKPMMLYHSLNLHALKGQNKHMLPMFWRANRKAWVMAAIFIDWFHYCFIPQVERYLVEKKTLCSRFSCSSTMLLATPGI